MVLSVARSKQNLSTETNVSSNQPPRTADLLRSANYMGPFIPNLRTLTAPTSSAPKGKPPVGLESSAARTLQQNQGLHQ